MKKKLVLLLLVLGLTSSLLAQPQEKLPRTLLPLSVLQDIINESSGELALQNEIYLTGVNRNRRPEEYQNGYFETRFILDRLKEYNFDEAAIIELPTSSPKTWDAEEAQLWLVEPMKKKLYDLKDVPTTLCAGSVSTDTTAELVDVGPGYSETFYQGKEVKDKIVLVYGSPERARQLAVEKFGAKGIIACTSSHSEFDRDQLGWNSIRIGEKDKPTFAFMVSERTYYDLKQMLERKIKVKVRAVVKSQMVPYREEMAMGYLKGTEKADQELVLTGHLFEGFAKQGANDDASGCVAILEAGRVIKQLVADGKIPRSSALFGFFLFPKFQARWLI